MKRISNYIKASFLLSCCFLSETSCIRQIDLSEGHLKEDVPGYLYPFEKEARNVTAEIIIRTATSLSGKKTGTEIPPLKYNKSWLFMLTQDDCKPAAYSTTWAAINGKPLTDKYYYNASQLYWGDLPPDIRYLGKTLGCTDGAGNEVRFSPTTTLAPDRKKMNDKVTVILGYQKNYNRFSLKSMLVWSNASKRADALYFVNMLKESEKKTELSNRIKS